MNEGNVRELEGQQGSMLKKYYATLQQSRAKRVAVAIAVSLVAFWLQLLITVSGADDDWQMSLFLSNAYPDSGYTLFVHPWLSGFVSFLFNVLSWGPNYFLIVEMALSFAATCVILYCAIGRMRAAGAASVATAVLLLEVPYCSQSLNFTVVTSLLAATGMLVLFAQLLDRRSSIASSLVGVFFVFAACLFRFKMVLLCAPFVAVLAVVAFVRSAKELPRERGLMFVPLVVALAVCGTMTLASNVQFAQPEWHEWESVNLPRSDLSDYPHRQYSEIADELAAIGVSENDYWLATHWTINDSGYFTEQKLREIADIACIHPSLSPASLLASLGKYLMRLVANPFLALVILASLLLLYGSWRKVPRLERLAAIAVLAITVAIAVYLETVGRVVPRVEYPVWTYGLVASALLVGLGRKHRLARAPEVDDVKRAASEFARLAAGSLLALVVAMSAYMEAVVSPTEDPVKSLLGMQHLESELFDYQSEHADCAFAYDYNVVKSVGFVHDKRALPPKEVIQTMQSFGGWEYGAAFLGEALNDRTGLDCGLFESLSKSDKVFLVTADDGYMECVLKFVREHYDPTAEAQVVETIRDSEMRHTFKIVRFVSAR